MSNENVLMKQSKADVNATKCLQHQCIEKELYAYYCVHNKQNELF